MNCLLTNMLLSSTKRIIFKVLNPVARKIQQRQLNISCQVEQLKNRSLIRVSGGDASTFLQGVVTNDMRHLQENCRSLYTMFLNTKGRVLYDSIIYKREPENTFFIECDQSGLQDLVKHLKMYRVRRKIDIDSIDNEWKLWVLFNPKETETNGEVKNVKQEQVVPCSFPDFKDQRENTVFDDIIISDKISMYRDPRLSSLGCRLIAPADEDVIQKVNDANIKVQVESQWCYHMFRYRLGIGEGVQEIPIGKGFPLEANCDYLHGVSFHKGCYIGQELTARTHHTGVVRKRLMPLVLETNLSENDYQLEMPIEGISEENKRTIGKLRGIEKNCAIGLMRIAEALEDKQFKVGNVKGETQKPFWWPQELPKERLDSGSTKRS